MILESLVPESGKVYYQPPANTGMVYPCIVFNRDRVKTEYADNVPYTHKVRYQVTVIDRDSDSEINAKVRSLPLCAFDRAFVSGNLYHDVYNIYF